MSKFSKFNNPKKRKSSGRRSPYSPEYVQGLRLECEKLKNETSDDFQKNLIDLAFDVSIKP